MLFLHLSKRIECLDGFLYLLVSTVFLFHSISPVVSVRIISHGEVSVLSV